MQNKVNVIVGLGKTGLSCLKFFVLNNLPCVVCDTRQNPPGLLEVKQNYPQVEIHLGPFQPEQFVQAKALVVSPGVSVKEPAIQAALKKGVEVIGDIELFARHFSKKIVGITGANGKTTVTTLMGEMAKASGKHAFIGGNIGVEALSLLNIPDMELAILELSSFQLETTHHLPLEVATILNVTPDHLDRYDSLDDYIEAKRRIYRQAKHIVYNRQDQSTHHPKGTLSFGLDAHHTDYGLIAHEGNLWLSKGAHRFMKTAELGMIGQHNALNALVSLAMGERLGFDQAAMIEVLKTFRGLEHRAEVVAKSQGVTWINDSKGTNTGACLAAIQGLGGEGEKNIHLIMGGRSKGADFSILQSAIQKVVKYLYLIGECADDLQKQFKDSVPIFLARNLETAVDLAQERIEPGDIVLLSPACASFDQYSNYIERGEHFSRLVHKRLKGKTE